MFLFFSFISLGLGTRWGTVWTSYIQLDSVLATYYVIDDRQDGEK